MAATAYQLRGASFFATEEAIGAFTCFDPDRPEATDLGPYGMVEEMRLFADLTRGLTHLLDVGALFGVFSLVFTERPDTTAYAIEPSPWAFPVLMEQAAANPSRNIVPLNCFTGDVEGRDVECGRDWKHVLANNFSRSEERVTLRETPIDCLGAIQRVDCMKIDVEGYECSVLRGAEKTIRRWKPLIFLECHLRDLEQTGDTAESLMDILRSYGYAAHHYQGALIESFAEMGFGRVLCMPE